MRFTGLFLYPDLGTFKSDSARAFRNQTRFICHYVQHFLADRKVQTQGFNRICVVCTSTASGSSYKNSSNTLEVEVPFDIAEYERTAEEDLPEYFIGLLHTGFMQCGRDEDLPVELFHEAIESFRKLGYRNQWVHSARTFRSAGLACRLLCELDLSSFHLILEVKHGERQVFAQEILRTLPDEVVYSHRFHDVVLEGQALIVRDKFGKSLFELHIDGA
ncbi:hypothetical protein [Massilia agri]|uniref:Uncharacterized protein n=1 Tax=Massilia agri TaxID=1886785 RepID=A0ABT2AHZ6_9BURK|nr:hypothetical protein [Massilia agri]MCS0595786.1 hypothetical protein [Massilia agri]